MEYYYSPIKKKWIIDAYREESQNNYAVWFHSYKTLENPKRSAVTESRWMVPLKWLDIRMWRGTRKRLQRIRKWLLETMDMFTIFNVLMVSQVLCWNPLNCILQICALYCHFNCISIKLFLKSRFIIYCAIIFCVCAIILEIAVVLSVWLWCKEHKQMWDTELTWKLFLHLFQC